MARRQRTYRLSECERCGFYSTEKAECPSCNLPLSPATARGRIVDPVGPDRIEGQLDIDEVIEEVLAAGDRQPQVSGPDPQRLLEPGMSR